MFCSIEFICCDDLGEIFQYQISDFRLVCVSRSPAQELKNREVVSICHLPVSLITSTL